MGKFLSKLNCCKQQPILDSSDLQLDDDTSTHYFDIKDGVFQRIEKKKGSHLLPNHLNHPNAN